MDCTNKGEIVSRDANCLYVHHSSYKHHMDILTKAKCEFHQWKGSPKKRCGTSSVDRREQLK